MGSTWDVLIADDDRAVAMAHYALVSGESRYRVAAIADTAEQSLRLLAALRPDLLLLDLALPGASGLTLLRALRARGVDVDVIVLTADRSSSAVRAALQLGVVDYLMKPFSPARLRRALRRFEVRAEVGRAGPTLDQPRTDMLTDTSHWLARRLPEGITEVRVEAVRATLLRAPSGLTAQQLAERIRSSRATAYRYLEHLNAEREVAVDEIVDGPGRPRRSYRLRGVIADHSAL